MAPRPGVQPACPARPDLYAAVQVAGPGAGQCALDNAASAKFREGNHAGLVSDGYVRITVFLAAVLFLVGIGSSFKLPGVRDALIPSARYC